MSQVFRGIRPIAAFLQQGNRTPTKHNSVLTKLGMVPMGSNSASGQGQASASQGQASVSQCIQDLASGRDLNRIEQEALTMTVAASGTAMDIGDFLMARSKYKNTNLQYKYT